MTYSLLSISPSFRPTGSQATEAGALFWLSSSATLALAKPAAKTATMTLVNMLAIDYLKESWLDLRNGDDCNGNRRVETMICNDVEGK